MKKEKTDYPKLEGLESNKEDDILPGYPAYPENEDIYDNYQEMKDIDPEDIRKTKVLNAKNMEDQYPDHDLDIPGSELDNDMEIIGSEDEENNYYSLGGDDHNDLDERQDD